MFKKILVATDTLAFCDVKVRSAAAIAVQNHAALYLLHVLESTSPIYRNFVKHFQSGEEILCTPEYQSTVKETINRNCESVLKKCDAHEIEIALGYPWEEILKRAKAKEAELIVLGPHTGEAEQKGVVRARGNIGSTLQGVITHERCPVMIIQRPIAEDHLNFNNVMVCVDFSDSCRYALEFAKRLSHRYGSRLFIFHAHSPSTAPEAPPSASPPSVDAVIKKLKEFCGDIPDTIPHQLHATIGQESYSEILKFALDEEIRLIAMGSHTKEKGPKWRVGSAVEQVSLRAPCPVVVVTDPKALWRMGG
jgi:nucleotide-binding universal stress UspA family protein